MSVQAKLDLHLWKRQKTPIERGDIFIGNVEDANVRDRTVRPFPAGMPSLEERLKPAFASHAYAARKG